tara:strand:- start:1548 stop:2723 length:1176 start_codon:yes stop_codon:yes gene_type:complete
MSYAIFTGKQRSLVFPVMCNGFLTIDYSDNVVSSASGIPYGIWDLDNNFTFECVLTPYEINGYGTHSSAGDTYIPTTGSLSKVSHSDGLGIVSNSKKIMPALEQSIYTAGTQNNHQSELYLPRANRKNHEMRIFHSTNFQVSLINDTLHNENNPARYKIKVGIKLGSTSMENFTTDAVILPNEGGQYDYASTADLEGFDTDGKLKYRRNSVAGSGSSGATINYSIGNSTLFNNAELFVRQDTEFVSIGTIASFTSSAITLSADSPVAISNGDILYIKHIQEPSYINNIYHIACSWDNENKEILIFFNGRLVKTATHTQTDSFTMAAEDFYVGANGTGATGANSATTNNQFMGELHELSIMNIRKTEFSAVNNLMPNLNNTVLYLRFEEVDE